MRKLGDREDPTKAEAEIEAQKLDQVDKLRDAIVTEAIKIESGKTLNVQLLLAYVRQLNKRIAPKVQEKPQDKTQEGPQKVESKSQEKEIEDQNKKSQKSWKPHWGKKKK